MSRGIVIIGSGFAARQFAVYGQLPNYRAMLDREGADGPADLAIVAINANDVRAYPADNAENMAKEAAAAGYRFPYLLDETQEVAKAYRAACTPDFFVFDADLRCVYRGQFDDARPGNDIPPSGHDVRAALDALLRGEAMSQEQKPSIGCNIKWKQ